MPYNTYAAKVGDTITITEPGREPLAMTVWLISPAGDAGRSFAAGPRIHAHIRPGGYAITFDAHSTITPHIHSAPTT